MMMLIENFRLALFSLKANKMRALLTMLGIIIGISSVIAIMTVGNSLTDDLSSSMSSLGAKDISVMVTYAPRYDEEGNEIYDNSDQRKITEDDYVTTDMINSFCEAYDEDVAAICVTEDVANGTIIDGKKYANVAVQGGNYGALYSERFELLGGRYFSSKEMSDGLNVAIVSDIVVENLFAGDNNAAIGSVINVDAGNREYPFTIVGVYKYETSINDFALGGSRKDTATKVHIPIRTAKGIAHKGAEYQSFKIILSAEADVETMVENTKSFFNDTYYNHNDTFYIDAFSMSSMVDVLTQMLDSVTLAISIIAGIALLVGGIGVMNIMMVSITERTREIGTRKALGATNGSIRMQFIIEAIVICVIGGIIGMILGIGLGMLASKLMEVKAHISASSVILSISFATAIGVFFGYYPANKAAKMDPIEALRYE